MAQDWFVVRAGKELGPFTAQQLRDMAAQGKLTPDDPVRRADMKEPRKASSIKGLFATPASEPAEPSASANPPEPEHEPGGGTKGLRSKKTVIALSAVGAAFLFLCCGGIAFFGVRMGDSARRQLADADASWDKGDRAGAAGKYRDILDQRRTSFLKDDEKARVYGRVIDFDMESGNPDAAKKLLAAAIDNKVEPTVNHPEARTALAAAVRERQASAEVRQFVWKQPDGWWGDALKSSDLRFSPMPTAEYAELVGALNSKKPEQVAKLLQHRDPHALFTRDELTAMATPYYGYHSFSRNVVKPGEEGYTEVTPKLFDAKKEKFTKPVFVVSGKPEDGVPDFGGGIVSGTCYRGFELQEEGRTKYLAKTVALHIDYSRGADSKITGVKGVRLKWITVAIPAIHNDEKCFGWNAVIVVANDRIEYVRFVEKRENALDKMEMDRLMPGGGKLAPADGDLYRIEYATGDPARPYTIHNVVLGTKTKGP